MKFPIEYGTIGNSKAERYLIDRLNKLEDDRLGSLSIKKIGTYRHKARTIAKSMKEYPDLSIEVGHLLKKKTIHEIKIDIRDSIIRSLLQNLVMTEYRKILRGEIVA